MIKSNLCQYKSKCTMPYEQNRCLNNYESCFIFQRFQALEGKIEIEDLNLGIGTMSAEDVERIGGIAQ